MDSVVHRGIMSFSQATSALRACATIGGGKVVRLMDPSAESGAETLFRLWLHSRRVDYRTQVPIGRYRVDFLVGRRLIVEILGAEFHASAEAFEKDATREAFLQSLGYQVLHISARQIYQRETERDEVLSALLRRRPHVFGPQV